MKISLFRQYKITIYVLCGFFVFLIQGCATYGASIEDVRTDIVIGDYDEAEIALSKAIDARGDDRLLYYLESGMLQHFKGNFHESNLLLEEAYLLIDPINSLSFSDQLKTFTLSPRRAKYLGNDFERSMVSFVKLLNYLNLATHTEQNSARLEALSAARVEARRIRIALDLAEIKAKKSSKNGRGFANNLFQVDQLLSDMIGDEQTSPVAPSSIPLLDWITSIIFEMLNEPDNARIAFDRSSNGYLQSFGHSPGIDIERVKKADSESTVNTGELVLVQMTGLIPQQGELSILAGFGGLYSGLYFSPSYSGTSDSRYEQSIWFDSVLGRPNGYKVWLGHAAGRKVVESRRNNTIHFNNVSRNYFESDSIILNVLFQGFRVALSYYPSSAYLIESESEVKWQNERYGTTLGLSLARKVVEDHAAQAWRELYLAFARELFQQVLAEQLYQTTQQSDSQFGALLGIIGKVGAYAGAQADTRSWLTLPREIQIARFVLPVGEQTLDVETYFRNSGVRVQQEVVVNIKPDQLNFISLYTAEKSEFTNVMD